MRGRGNDVNMQAPEFVVEFRTLYLYFVRLIWLSFLTDAVLYPEGIYRYSIPGQKHVGELESEQTGIGQKGYKLLLSEVTDIYVKYHRSDCKNTPTVLLRKSVKRCSQCRSIRPIGI